MSHDLGIPPRRRGGWLAVLGVAVVLLAYPLSSVVPQEPGGAAQNVLAGSRLFGAMGCARCHAVRGVGGTVGPDLGRLGQPQSFYDFAAAMWNHLPQMARRMDEIGIERPRLDPWEAADLIAFLTWLDYFDPPGDTDTGRQLFAEKMCVVCHQLSGVGGVAGPGLDFLGQYGSPIQIAAAMWNHGPAMADAMRARGIERPSFTASELTDLIAYLESASGEMPTGPLYVLPGRPEAGRRRFVERGCIECHSVKGEGGRLGPDLGEVGRYQNLIEFAVAMWNKAPAMMRVMERRGISVPMLSAAEMADLVAYLSSVRYFRESGNAGRGERRLRDKGCLSCHALRGRGGETAGDLTRTGRIDSPAAVVAALWNHALLPGDPAGTRADTWPTFSPGEMADLAAYLQSLSRGR